MTGAASPSGRSDGFCVLVIKSMQKNSVAAVEVLISAEEVALIKIYMKGEIKQFLDWKATYATQASISYAVWLRRFAELYPEKQVSEITLQDVVKFRNILAEKYSPTSVSYAMVILKCFFRWLIDCGYKVVSPGLIRAQRCQANSHKPISEEDYKKLQSVIATNDFWSLRDKVIFSMLWDTGIRISELCELDTAQISEEVPRTVIKTKKTGNKRPIMWSHETHSLLLRYLYIRKELTAPQPALFVGKEHGTGWISVRLTPRSIQRHLKIYLDAAGIKKRITPHSFRHGWALKRREMGAQLPFIQRALGHSHPASTFVYQQYSDPSLEREAGGYLL